MRQKGLTIMELLTVISILATLMALVYPVYLRVKSRAYTTSCLSQLHQIGLAVRMYAEDQGDGTPYSMPWGFGKLYPSYVKSKELLVCPYFRTMAPEVVEEMHRISQARFGHLWTSYWQFSPKGLDGIAEKNPEQVSFREVYAERGEGTPIAYCDTHRNGCPHPNFPIYNSPRGAAFAGCVFSPGMIKCTGCVFSPDQPLVILRWGGSVSLVPKSNSIGDSIILMDY